LGDMKLLKDSILKATVFRRFLVPPDSRYGFCPRTFQSFHVHYFCTVINYYRCTDVMCMVAVINYLSLYKSNVIDKLQLL
jgi:hypothetical protein